MWSKAHPAATQLSNSITHSTELFSSSVFIRETEFFLILDSVNAVISKFTLITLSNIQISAEVCGSEQILRWSKDCDLLLNFSEKFWKYPRSLYWQVGKF